MRDAGCGGAGGRGRGDVVWWHGSERQAGSLRIRSGQSRYGLGYGVAALAENGHQHLITDSIVDAPP